MGIRALAAGLCLVCIGVAVFCAMNDTDGLAFLAAMGAIGSGERALKDGK